MKNFLVIGNPIDHSLSPKLHNYWIKSNNINAIYEKKEIEESDLQNIISKIREKKIHGLNVTVPFKQKIIPYLDKLSFEAENTQSVNTVYLDNNKIIGHNTDIDGFEFGIKATNFEVLNKKVLILGAGGVVPSIIFTFNKMKANKVIVSNRTKERAESLKSMFKNIDIVEWGSIPYFDIIVNATSLGLDKKDVINLDFSKTGQKKLFYDIIYNPKETNFLKMGKQLGNITENGKLMFIQQASAAFKVWHGVQPKITNKVIQLLDK